MKHLLSIATLTAVVLVAGNALAAPVLYTPIASTPAGANLVSATLSAQNDLLQKDFNTRAAAAAQAQSNSVDATASLITQQVEANIASIISQTITNADGKSPNTGTFSLGGGQVITYNRLGGSTSVSIRQVGKQTIELSFPNIQ